MHQLKVPLILLLACLVLLTPAASMAEQKETFGAYEVHYIVIPTTFLKPQMAAKYGITRSENRSLLNVSVLHHGTPVEAKLAAHTKNLLSQINQLEFDEVREGPAIYYLALIRHSDEEVHQISLSATFDDGSQGAFEFQQRLYHE